MKELKKAQIGMIAILTVMLVSITRRLPTRKLSSGITTLALAGIVLLVAAGSASALPACPAPGNADISASCELTQDYTVTTAGQYGYKIIVDNVVIDGKGWTLTGTMPATCGGGEAAPCTCAGVINYDFDNAVVKDLEITGFCTGVVMGDNAADDVVNMTVTGCKIHNCGESAGTTHGIHLVRANDCTISKNEIYEIDGNGIAGGCVGGGNGIFGYGADLSHGNYGSVTCNYLHDNNKSGVFTKKCCQHWTFANNNASVNGEGGIVPMCKKSSFCTIEYNIMTGNDAFGYKSQANQNTLRFNTITNNGQFGIVFKSDKSIPYGMNNEAYNNTICGHTTADINQIGDDNGTNKADSNTCDSTMGTVPAGACDWSCDTKVPVYYDYDGDAHYSAVSCSCGNILSVGACCNPGLFNDTGASTHCSGGVCVLSAGDDPNDCDPGAPAAQPYYCDDDADGYFNADSSGTAEELPPDCQWTQGDDCDDTNPNVNPGAAENCTDDIDNDCDGLIDDDDPDCITYTNNVYIVPEDSSAAYGETTTVEIYANTTDSFQGGQFYLDYQDGCANVTDVTFDPMWPFTSDDLTTYPGAVFATFRKDNPMVNGLQHICTLTIECDNPDYCTGPLDFKLAGEVLSGKDSKLTTDMGASLPDQGWHDDTFTCMNLPDLDVTEVYGVPTGTGDNYTVNYTVTNIGNAGAAAGHIATLSIGEANDPGNWIWIENMAVPDVLAPGGSYTGTFNTTLTMTAPNDLMKVCADTGGDVMELDETNNNRESFYPAGIEIRVVAPDECVDFQEQFTVDITVDPRNIPTYGVQYTLSFNNEVLHCEWQNEGTFLNHDGADTNVYINTIDNGAGTIAFAATRTGTTVGVIDPGTLATIKFTAIQQGADTNLNLSDIVVSNNLGSEILPVDDINDTVCVWENMPPVAIGKSMHKYNNDGQKYICKVYFNGTESYDGDGNIVYWRWGFGDGNYGTGDLKDHVYQSWNWNGSGYDPFMASLTVTDDGDPHQLDNTTYFDVIVYTAGDANGDGKVNILDATIVGLEWGATTDCSGACCWEGNDRGSKADLNNDCKVNILDAVIIGTCWGHTAW